MKTDIYKHLLGIYSVFSARINLINASIGHSATQGEETENEVRDLLADFLPSKFGLGSGIIIDTLGNATKQIDIIIFDKNRSDYTLSTSSKIFLADHVIAAIEIKTTYTTGKNSSLDGALSNIESVKKLKVAPHKWIESNFNPETKCFEYTKYSPTAPLGIVFFFKAQETHSALAIDTFFDNLRSSIDKIPIEHQPDLLFSLDHAAFFRHFDIGKRTKETSNYSVSLVQLGTDKTQIMNIDGMNQKTKALIDFAHEDFPERKVLNTTLLKNDKATSQLHLLGGDTLDLNPTIYRVAKIRDKFFLLDKFRSFLNFVWAIEKIVSMKRMSKAWSPTDYFGNTFPLASTYPNDFDG